MSIGNTAPKNPLAARMQGVRVARDTSGTTEAGTPNVVNLTVPAEWVVINYNDARGRAVSALYLKVGDAYYASRDTVEWTGNLLPMTDWIKQQLDAKAAEKARDAKPVAMPTTDAVDLLESDEET